MAFHHQILAALGQVPVFSLGTGREYHEKYPGNVSRLPPQVAALSSPAAGIGLAPPLLIRAEPHQTHTEQAAATQGSGAPEMWQPTRQFGKEQKQTHLKPALWV